MINRLNIRQLSEKREEGLSPYATKSTQSRGRLKQEAPCPIRTAFQRDRDRIIYAKAFRRLKHKTQVFIAPQGDHFVTRLTHTLEVSQIGRTLARALNLNEDLAEAIALGHDIGHTPFGHVGEEVLNELYPPGFRHNEQSLRIVDVLENNGRGLNLTWEVRDGILNHSKSRVNILEDDWGEVNTLEGEICKIADIVAYINHDIGDAIRADIITEADLPHAVTGVLGHSHQERLNTMISDIIEYSWHVSGRGTATPAKPAIGMSPCVLEASNTLRNFLFERVYELHSDHRETEKAREVVRFLYDYFARHAGEMPPEYSRNSNDTERSVVDYIAGMTDQYASRLAEELSAKP